MEEAAELGNYLPLSFKSRSEQEYIAFLWDAFETNYTHGKYQFAFLAYHMLTMSIVYFNIWQIRRARLEDFAKGLIGFGKDIETNLLEATSPFVFSSVNERSILRLLKLIACDNAKIGTYAKLVDARNQTTHPNGHIFFSTQAALDTKIIEILRVVDEIQTYSKPIIEQCYREFLLQNYDPEEREYPGAADQIREVLIHENYLSQKDIEICLGFDLAGIADRPEINSIRSLHEVLQSEYGPDEEIIVKRIELIDAMTGKLLDIKFDLDADKMRINGQDVVRKPALESNEDQFVYAPPSIGPTIIFHLTREQVEKMKMLWRS